uniref:Uncharacterized protein n=1 Tax=Anguilla anguilla TaxID=7936 RepID=A0A0E9RYQ4_ANGAN
MDICLFFQQKNLFACALQGVERNCR